MGIGGSDDDRIGPLKPLGHVARVVSHWIVGPHIDRPRLPGSPIQSRQEPTVASRVVDVDIERIGGDVSALPATDVVEVVTGAITRDTHRRVVLLRAANVIRHVLGREHVVQLCGRKALTGPRLTTVHRHVGAAIIGVDQPLGIVEAIHTSWLSPCGTRMLLMVLAASVDR